ncbi:hypothetical protein [Cognatishimia maritima]|nr:hypothetical protein [Cognatishimia maritima]
MTDQEVSTNAEAEEETFYGLSCDPDILEKLLLAIIRANTDDKSEESDAIRLNKAMHSLVGKSASKYAVTNDADYKALRYMGELLHRDECNRDMHKIKHYNSPNPPDVPKVRTPHALAFVAAKQFAPHAYDEEDIIRMANRLREKFNGTYYKKSKSRPKINSAMTFKYMAVEHDGAVESVEFQALEKICAVLAKHGVKTKLK